MKGRILLLCMAIAGSQVAGCTTDVTYRKPRGTDVITDPGKNESVFALRQSELLLAAKPEKLGEPAAAKDVCNGATTATPEQCLAQMEVAAAPVVDTDGIYVVHVPRNISLTITGSDAEPLLPTKVVQAYRKSGSTLVAAVGTSAAAGSAFGPWGAVAGGLLGGGSVILANAGGGPKIKSKPAPITLNLPVRIPGLTGKVASPFRGAGWTRLPPSSSGDVNTGWYYRVAEASVPDRPKASLIPVLYAGQDGSNTPSGRFVKRTTFDEDLAKETSYWPASACRAVSVVLGRKDDGTYQEVGRFKSVIADPALLQLVTFQKDGRTIVYGTQCGIYATSNPVVVDPVGAALIKAASDIKKAQSE